MTKKNLPQRVRNSAELLLGYRLPKFCDNPKSSFVEYYVKDPYAEKLIRRRIHLEKYTKKTERKQQAALVVDALTRKLMSGWNPLIEEKDARGFVPFAEVLDSYEAHVRSNPRERTVVNYTSRIKILKEFNASRLRPIIHAYQYDTPFINEFLDWCIRCRNVGPRTRNNYRGWCSALGQYMHSRGFLPNNPAADIQKIRENAKRRQPLTAEMLQKVATYLQKHDKHFLLAVYFQYFTFIRPTELSYLKIGDISVMERSITVDGKYSKNHKTQSVGLNDILLDLMLELGVLTLPSSWYIFGKDFTPAPKRARPDIFNKRWAVVRKALKISSEYQFYSLKDSGIRDLANAQGIVIARDQARHSDISTTNRYLGKSKNIHRETLHFDGFLGQNR